MRFFGALAVCVALVGCGTEKKSDNEKRGNNPPESPGEQNPGGSPRSQNLGLVGTEHGSFRDYPIEQRCRALKEALEGFASQHTPGVSIVSGKCDNLINKSHPGYQVDFEIVEGEVRDARRIEISELNAKQPRYLFITGNGGGSVSGYDDELGKIHANLGHLHTTLLAFVGEPKADATIYGHTYGEFSGRVVEVAPTGRLTLGDETQPVKIELTLDGQGAKTGTVKFLEVPEQAFAREADGLTSASSGVLGCSTIECLNEGGIRFEFEEQVLLLVREIRENSSTTVRTWVGWSFDAFPTDALVPSRN